MNIQNEKGGMRMNMPFGMIALLILAIAVYFGVAQRLLDRMRLTDRGAILFILGMAAGSFLDIPILQGNANVSLNVGGGILPAALSLWLIFTVETVREKMRAIVAVGAVAGIVFLGSIYLPNEPESMLVDPKIIYGVAAGGVAYLVGRSRRSAFIGGVLGIIVSDIVHVVTLVNRGVIGVTSIGGAGVFDVTVIAGLVAIMMAEFVGEANEKLQGAPRATLKDVNPLLEISEELSVDDKAKKTPSQVLSLQKKLLDKQKRGDKHE